MINKKIDELFEAINNSKEYQDYLNISNSLENNEEINNLITEIKTLQKKSVKLEEKGDLTYKEIDKEI